MSQGVGCSLVAVSLTEAQAAWPLVPGQVCHMGVPKRSGGSGGQAGGQVEGRPHTQVHKRQTAALPSTGQEGAAATHVQPGTWTSASLASGPICTGGTLNHLL